MPMKIGFNSATVVILFCLFIPWSAVAQVDEDRGADAGFHRLMLVMGHTHVPAGLDLNGKKKWLTLASWGLDYDYWISHKWAIGLHSDMVVENYTVRVNESFSKDEVLKRTAPVSLVASGIYKPTEHLNVIGGFGEELSKEENLFLLRVGLDMGWELGEKYEVSISLISDFKLEAYNSITLGIAIGRIFR